MTKKAYIDGTTLDIIIEDGWMRGFDISQTYEEAVTQGFDCTIEDIRKEWAKLDDEIYAWCEANENQ